MKSFSNINFSTLSLFESIMTASQIIREDFPVSHIFSELKNKINEARTYISSEMTPHRRLKKLLDLFYNHWKFRSASGIYNISDTLWIDNVLKTNQGTAASLGVIFLYIAQELKLPLNPVVFPTQLILRADWINKKTWLINPFDGDILNRHVLDVWLRGNISPTAKLYEHDLYKSESITVVRKILDMLKSALIEEKKIELALNVSNLLLNMNPNDPYEIRDRGLIYSQLGCNHIALTDLIYFIEHCPEDPISEIIKMQIHSIKHKKIVIH